ncbi:hypothetical protein [Ligilactobacillus acidipiscis]|uniref:hypothetical protein n=1 Tax=Ligilactobacillus acidipiscis TaxID=89059 RepID=UPI0023F8AE0F|nr:hypothetical protein [Ligilactobacillus acidipiscis]WEV56156.1 hypothetical protein OZX66_07825 [Ligilactobacillus acidipiscis]
MKQTEEFQLFAKTMIENCKYELNEAHKKGTPQKAIEYLRRTESKLGQLDFGDGFTLDEKEFVVGKMRDVFKFAEQQIRNEAMRTPFIESEDDNE